MNENFAIFPLIKLVLTKTVELFYPDKVRFRDHYIKWNNRRIKCIIDYYGKNFFRGKKILEVGCGYGDIGAEFMKLGAEVTCSDARREHLDIVERRYPNIKTVLADLDYEWPFRKKFDVILHLGTLYHLKNFEKSLIKACKTTKYLVLETEVCDSDDPDMVVFTNESRGYDQSFNKRGSRPSAEYIEKILKKAGMKYEQVKSSKCNSGFHRYNWKVKNTGKWSHGLRRFWFAYKPKH